MAKFKMTPTAPTKDVDTARMGATSAKLVDNDKGKLVKLAADSQYSLCAAGDSIEGVFIALESGTQDNFAIGSVQKSGKVNAICDGLEATVGTGTIAVGDYVLCGTVVAAGTALTSTTGPKVVKATYQPGTDLTNINQTAELMKAVMFPWRVVSLGSAGAVGDTCVIEKV